MKLVRLTSVFASLVLLLSVACGGGDDDADGSANSGGSAPAPTQTTEPEPADEPAPGPTDGPAAAPTEAPEPATSLASSPVKAPLTITYKVPPGGAAPAEELPFPAGSVEAQWYVAGDRYVVRYAGLMLDGDPPLCPGNSIQTATGFQFVSNSPAEAGACEGATTLPAEATAGVILCGDEVLYVTQIPAGSEGILFGTIEVFLADGTIIGLTSQSPTNLGEAPAIGEALQQLLGRGDCEGPLR